MTDDPARMDEVFARLAESAFRRRFRLRGDDLAYVRRRGMDTILRHADEMIAARLAPAEPPNDGKQTPMRGHPVFLAQHATGTCCRGCLAKWHRIPKGRELADGERRYVVSVIARWIAEQDRAAPAEDAADESPSRTPSPSDDQLGLGM
jgi:predicted Fe-S protein YdhL (DUF1289 family)